MYKKLSSKVLLDHPRVRVIEDQIELPNGEKSDYVVIDDILDGTRIIARNGKGEILLVNDYFYLPNRKVLSLPGGKIKKGQTPEETANIELMEEAGFRAKKVNLIGSIYLWHRRMNQKEFIFYVTDLVKENLPEDSEEAGIESIWFKEEEIDQMIKEGTIDDQYTIAAWGLYKLKKSELI